jgi:arylsulfotransferase ASST
MVDDTGEVVWFRPSDPNSTIDFRAGIYKGKPVLTWWEGRHYEGVGLRGSYVVMDSSYREIARFRSRDDLAPDFHEYLLTPDDTALVSSYEPVPANLSRVGGPSDGMVYEGVVRELEIPSGDVLFEWRSLKYVPLEDSYQTQVGDTYDYFHLNSIGYDTDGHLLVSARNTWTVYKVDRRTGEVIWRLGGKRSSFQMGAGATFAFQHDARAHDHGRLITLFDNGPRPETKPQSRAITLALDETAMRATLARQLLSTPPRFARATGNQQVLPNGNALVCWGVTGAFSEFSRSGKLLLDGSLPKGGQNYRVLRFPWVGQPTDRPRIASRAAVGEPIRVYASWNGATEVAWWHVRAGKTRTRLAPGIRWERRGFETELPVAWGSRYASVVAVDRHGKRLGVSETIRLHR